MFLVTRLVGICVLPLVSKRVEASGLSKDWALRVQAALLRVGYSDVVSTVHICPHSCSCSSKHYYILHTVLLCPNWLYSWVNITIWFRDFESILHTIASKLLVFLFAHTQFLFSDAAQRLSVCLDQFTECHFQITRAGLNRQRIWWNLKISRHVTSP